MEIRIDLTDGCLSNADHAETIRFLRCRERFGSDKNRDQM